MDFLDKKNNSYFCFRNEYENLFIKKECIMESVL